MTTEPNNDNTDNSPNENDDDTIRSISDGNSEDSSDGVDNVIGPTFESIESKLTAGTDLTPEELRKAHDELQNYRKALDQEFAEAAEKAVTSEEVMETTIDFFKKKIPSTAAHIAWLSENSTSDGVRLSACKYIVDCVRKGVADSHTDPVNDILKKIFANNDQAVGADGEPVNKAEDTNK